MISILGDVEYEHSLTARFNFSFGTVELSVAFFDNVVYVVLPDDKTMFWKVVAVDRELLIFLQTLKSGIDTLQFIIRFGTQVVRKEGHTGLDLTNIQVSLDRVKPSEMTPTPYGLPFGSR